MPRVSVSLRLEPELLLLAKKIAKEEYGSESKKGYVVENAISLYHSQRLQPTEVASILSVTEEKLIDRLDKRFADIGKNIIDRIGNLQAKNVYETCLTSLLVEDVHSKAGFNKNHYEQKRKEAAVRMKKRYNKEGLEEVGGVIEENEHLNEVNKNVQSRLEQAAKTFEQLKLQIQTLETNNQDLKKELQQKDQHQKRLQSWTNDFTNHLIKNYSRITSNSALVNDFIKENPIPKETPESIEVM